MHTPTCSWPFDEKIKNNIVSTLHAEIALRLCRLFRHNSFWKAKRDQRSTRSKHSHCPRRYRPERGEPQKVLGRAFQASRRTTSQWRRRWMLRTWLRKFRFGETIASRRSWLKLRPPRSMQIEVTPCQLEKRIIFFVAESRVSCCAQWVGYDPNTLKF